MLWTWMKLTCFEIRIMLPENDTFVHGQQEKISFVHNVEWKSHCCFGITFRADKKQKFNWKTKPGVHVQRSDFSWSFFHWICSAALRSLPVLFNSVHFLFVYFWKGMLRRKARSCTLQKIAMILLRKNLSRLSQGFLIWLTMRWGLKYVSCLLSTLQRFLHSFVHKGWSWCILCCLWQSEESNNPLLESNVAVFCVRPTRVLDMALVRFKIELTWRLITRLALLQNNVLVGNLDGSATRFHVCPHCCAW